MAARNSARLSAAVRSRLGRRLKQLLTAREMTQEQLAEAASIDRGLVSRLANGHTNPTLGTLLAVAEALELHSLEELLAPHGLQLLMPDVAMGTPGEE